MRWCRCAYVTYLRNRTRNVVVTLAVSCTTLTGMEEKAIRRAALITLRRAICERFPPGPERQKSLALLVAAGNERAASRSGAP